MLTKDKADEAVKAAIDAVAEEAKRWITPKEMTATPPESFVKATLALHDAERARADLDRPRLMTAENVWLEARDAGHPGGWRQVSRETRAIVLADLLAQAEQLVTKASVMDRPITDMGVTIIPTREVVLWEDLKALIGLEPKRSGEELDEKSSAPKKLSPQEYPRG